MDEVSRTKPVVVVMDDAGEREAMVRALSRAGFTSVRAMDASMALALLRSAVPLPGTILVDGGLEPQLLQVLLRFLDRFPELRTVPVVLIQKRPRPIDA